MKQQLCIIADYALHHLNGATIVGLVLDRIEHPAHEDDFTYWEERYYVAWTKNGMTYGTHQVQVNSNDECMFTIGHYELMSKQDAIGDMLERANLTVGRI